MSLTASVKRIPVVGSAVRSCYRRIFRARKTFVGSGQYWEQRYQDGGNSGPGSYDRLAEFKATTLNAFVEEQNVSSVIEFGCGDGNQLSLANYPKYIGLDVSKQAIRMCRERFRDDETKQFACLDEETELSSISQKADLAISLDVIYHLVEDEVFDRYMSDLFDAAEQFVIIYSSNFDAERNFHVRDRCFTSWISQHRPSWKQVRLVENPYPFDPANPNHSSRADFYMFAHESLASDVTRPTST